MKLFKTFAAVATLAVLSAPALANIKAVNNGTSELFLAVGDQNGSFILDTGITLNALLGGATFSQAVAGAAWTAYTAADTNLFDGASNSTSGTRWALFVYDGSTAADFTNHRVITTLGKNISVANLTFDVGTLVASYAATGGVGQNANGTGTHPSVANGSSYNAKGTLGYAGANFFKFGDTNTFIGNKVGDSSSLFLLTGNPEDGTDSTLQVVASKLTLNASFDGATLSVSAVPEPQSYALMAAGLAAVGFIARRRRNPA